MNTSPLNIIIVENDRASREGLHKLLIQVFPNVTVSTAADVKSGRALLLRTEADEGNEASKLVPVDIVILDFRLPVETGGEEIDTSLCELSRRKHPNSLVIHLTANASHEKAKAHLQEVHPSACPTVGGNTMETQHMGIVIEKGLPKDDDLRRLGREIVEAISRRQKLKTIETGLSQLLDDTGNQSSGSRRRMGRVGVPDSGLTGHLAGMSLALEDAWSWLPERTKKQALSIFKVHEVPGSPDQVYIQML